MDKYLEPGKTAFGTALENVYKILDEATEPDTLLDILKEIRLMETSQFKFVPGYAGAWKAERIEYESKN